MDCKKYFAAVWDEGRFCWLFDANRRLCADYKPIPGALVAGFIVYGVKIHIFAKNIFLCSVIAGREREPRKRVIPGQTEVLPLEAEDLRQLAEVAAEVPGKMKAPDGRTIKAVMPKDQHVAPAVIPTNRYVAPSKEAETVKGQRVAHLIKAERAKDLPAFLTKEAETVKDRPGARLIKAETEKDPPAVHLTKAVMAKDLPGVHSTKVETEKDQPGARLIKAETVKDQPAVHLIKAETEKDQPAVHLTKAVMAKDLPAAHTKEAEMVKDQPAVHLTKAVIAIDQPDVRLTKAVMAKDLPAAHTIEAERAKDLNDAPMREVLTAKIVTTASRQRKVIQEVNQILLPPMEACVLTNSFQTREYVRDAKQTN